MKELFKTRFQQHLTETLVKSAEQATENDKYKAVSMTIRDMMAENWVATNETYAKKKVRKVYYLSLEYLMGRALGNAMINIEAYSFVEEAIKELGLDLKTIRDEEVDAGLGNGGLGRLAACFIDSLATMELPATGYGIRYDYGIFKQNIENGYQVEEPDNWLRGGNVWEIQRSESARKVHFYGHTELCRDSDKSYKKQWVNTSPVLAMPYDTPIPGYGTKTINTLRLWSADALYGFNLSSFNQGDYLNANLASLQAENISKVLYPNDNNYEGKELRLKQQYFLCAATLADIIAEFKATDGDMLKFHERNCLQLNDTHPSMAIPEFMRILVDEEDMDWDTAWNITTKTFNYTNHTLMPEALEKWPTNLLEKLLPRHLEVIYEINMRFLREVANKYPGDGAKLQAMSLIDDSGEKSARMAYIAIVGSSHVNGVAALHTELLKEGLFNDFYQLTPEKFVNVTNGITPRRWLLKANPELSALITDKIGNEWPKDLDQLEKFAELASNKTIQKQVAKIKLNNKKELAAYIKENNGIDVNPNSIFDVQIKRLHEYKRQFMNILHAVALYLDIKDNPDADFTPRTVIFGAKAAPGYHTAKLIIKFINSVADVINNDPDVGDKLKVAFLSNYRISLAEIIIPATDLSEQISLAGTEASGTGNMKFALNGALTIGTMDGANVEIHDCVGKDNIFIFGMDVREAQKLKSDGYNAYDFIQKSPRLGRILDLIKGNFFSQSEPGVFNELIDTFNWDNYMVAADFDSYYDKQKDVEALYNNQSEWTEKAIINIGNMGMFSSDRSMRDYSEKIWNIKPVKISK